MNLFCFWVVQIPIAYFLSKVLRIGPPGVFAAQAFSFSLVAVIGILLFRKGCWKEVKV
jgi:Na+-driven multidrug efflux pump